MTAPELQAEHDRLAAEAQALGEKWLEAHVHEHRARKVALAEALAENNQARKRVERKLRKAGVVV